MQALDVTYEFFYDFMCDCVDEYHHNHEYRKVAFFRTHQSQIFVEPWHRIILPMSQVLNGHPFGHFCSCTVLIPINLIVRPRDVEVLSGHP